VERLSSSFSYCAWKILVSALEQRSSKPLLVSAVIIVSFSDDSPAVNTRTDKNQEEVRSKNGVLTKIVESLGVGEEVLELGEQASLAVWCLCLGNAKMKSAFRTANVIIPLVELLDKNTNCEPLVINTLGAISTLCSKSSKPTPCAPDHSSHHKNTETNRQLFKEAGLLNTISPLASQSNAYLAQQVVEIQKML
jgi:hypothetical protein